MQIAIRSIGNSKGIVIPKAMLAQAGLGDVAFAAVAVENGSIVLRKPENPVRESWAAAAAAIAANGDEELLMGEFGNADDQGNTW
ncbi:AbrB/MazE/SpoVT family DNA-binding domain-containing protein [Ottowia thiooxydans]|uniref:AbrB/MazE/SpoVT family DNA-binding domain-containing protein n=1 Tax=Ottowia thiooxydans TaxID=219182 RepID=UPI000418E120|nr:antitoxin [Ottowia thiooxydans]